MRARRLAVAIAAVLLAACGGSGTRTGDAGAATTEPTQTFVAIGAGGTKGGGLTPDEALQFAWPRVVFREAFPRATVFVNAAVDFASANSALQQQLPLVEQLQPSTVAIWLGTIEAASSVAPEAFESDLATVVRRVRATGARVLLGDLPPIPGVDVARYNRVIAQVASAQGATLVALHDDDVPMVMDDEPFLPDRAGQEVVARAFEAALRQPTPP